MEYFEKGMSNKEIMSAKTTQESIAGMEANMMSAFVKLMERGEQSDQVMERVETRIAQLEGKVSGMSRTARYKEAVKKGRRTLYFQPVRPEDWSGQGPEADITPLLALYGIKQHVRILDCWQNGKAKGLSRLMVEFDSESTAELVMKSRNRWQKGLKVKDDRGRDTDEERKKTVIKSWVHPLLHDRHQLLIAKCERVREIAKGDNYQEQLSSIINYVGDDLNLQLKVPGGREYIIMEAESEPEEMWMALVKHSKEERERQEERTARGNTDKRKLSHTSDDDVVRQQPDKMDVSVLRSEDTMSDLSLNDDDILTVDEGEHSLCSNSREKVITPGPQRPGGSRSFNNQHSDIVVSRGDQIKKIFVVQTQSSEGIRVVFDQNFFADNCSPAMQGISGAWHRSYDNMLVLFKDSLPLFDEGGSKVGDCWNFEVSERDGTDRREMKVETSRELSSISVRGEEPGVFWEKVLKPFLKCEGQQKSYADIFRRGATSGREIPKPFLQSQGEKCRSCSKANIKGKQRCRGCGARIHGKQMGCMTSKGLCKPCATLPSLQRPDGASPALPPPRNITQATPQTPIALEESMDEFTTPMETTNMSQAVVTPISANATAEQATPTTERLSATEGLRRPLVTPAGAIARVRSGMTPPSQPQRNPRSRKKVPLPSPEKPVIRALEGQVSILRLDNQRLMKYITDLERRNEQLAAGKEDHRELRLCLDGKSVKNGQVTLNITAAGSGTDLDPCRGNDQRTGSGSDLDPCHVMSARAGSGRDSDPCQGNNAEDPKVVSAGSGSDPDPSQGIHGAGSSSDLDPCNVKPVTAGSGSDPDPCKGDTETGSGRDSDPGRGGQRDQPGQWGGDMASQVGQL